LVAPVIGGAAGRKTAAGGWICDVDGLAAGRGLAGGRGAGCIREVAGRVGLGSGSVAGRVMALRGSICDDGILPPGIGGSPPVGASDEARGPCTCD
jgi:hypothetical protein